MTDNTKYEVTLLPCPFCGSEPEGQPWHSEHKWFIQCSNSEYEYPHGCPVGPQMSSETREKAEAQWNMRHRLTSQPAQGDLDAATGCADDLLPGSAEEWREAAKLFAPTAPQTDRESVLETVREAFRNLELTDSEVAEIAYNVNRRYDHDPLDAQYVRHIFEQTLFHGCVARKVAALLTHPTDTQSDYAHPVGALVEKPKGYPFPGTVVSAFGNLAGEPRYVVENDLAPGMLHIFSGSQITIRNEAADTGGRP